MKNRMFLLLILALFCLSTMTAFAAEDVVNVALYQPATASSVCDESHTADLANDGINDNEAYTWWMSKSGDTAIWWQVDLGLAYKISGVEIAAKIGGNAAERKNIRILASNKADFGESVEIAAVEGDYGELFSAEVNKKGKFRYIRVEKSDQTVLSMGEFRVLVKKTDITQGAEAVSVAGQMPATDEAGRYVLPADVVGTPYEKAVQLLSALNIMRGYPDGDFMPKESITRAEFATVVTRMLGTVVPAGARTFIDVKPEHWAYSAIETAAKMEIVNGVSDGFFEPDSTVTTSQVIKMLVSALGYGDVAMNGGGFPVGYQNVATKLNLFKGVTLQNGENINRGEIAMLVYNALECDVMNPSVAGEYITSVAYEGKTVLTENLHLSKAKGIVTGVRGTSLTDVNRKKTDDYLEINGEAFTSQIPNLEQYLGYCVEYYYDNMAIETPEVVAVVVASVNSVITIDASELIGFDDYVLTYGADEEEKIDLSKEMDVIFNGVARRTYSYNDLLPTSGQVTLIDNNGDLEYDVYIVLDIQNYIVNWVNLNKKVVYTKDAAGSLPLDVEESRITMTDRSTGAPVALEALEEWNVLSVMESVNTEGEKCYQIIVSSEFIRGQLEGRDDETLTISGRKVGFADNFDVEALEMGAKGFFYLDGVGKVAAFNGDTVPGEQYGFLREVSYPDSGLNRKLQLRMLTKKGVFETLTAAENFYLNGTLVTDKSTVAASLAESGLKGTRSQAVYYVVNASGLVTSVETTKGALKLDYDAENSIGAAPIATDMGGYYLSVAETFDSVFSYNEETMMINLPPGDALESEKDYRLLTAGDIKKSTYYKVKAYDAGTEQVAKMIIFSGGGSTNAGDSEKLFLVDKLVSAVNEEGDVSYKVSGIYRGEEVSYFIGSDVTVKEEDFARGTVMTLAFMGEEIADYQIKFFADKKPDNAPDYCISAKADECQDARNTRGVLGGGFIGYGKVAAKKDGIITVVFEGVTGEEGASYKHLVVRMSALDDMYLYDRDEKKISFADAKDVLDEETVGTADASYVIITADSGLFRECIIFN